ncbi:MAG: YciI family protein [Kineosporiaceae bacterium]
MAKYLVLIYGDERVWEAMTEQDRADCMAAHDRFSQAAGEAVLGGEELMSTSTATTLRPGPSGVATTDGPFAETKEALGGFYLLDVPDLDAALALAAMLPEAGLPNHSIEVRPVVDHG